MVVNPTCTKNFLYKKKYPAALRRGFFICINPSTATPEKPDPAMRKIKVISGINGYDSCIMLNVYSQRATDPNALPDKCDTTIHEKKY
jgi:hypothetical protein